MVRQPTHLLALSLHGILLLSRGCTQGDSKCFRILCIYFCRGKNYTPHPFAPCAWWKIRTRRELWNQFQLVFSADKLGRLNEAKRGRGVTSAPFCEDKPVAAENRVKWLIHCFLDKPQTKRLLGLGERSMAFDQNGHWRCETRNSTFPPREQSVL